jgi:hypothetical protein
MQDINKVQEFLSIGNNIRKTMPEQYKPKRRKYKCRGKCKGWYFPEDMVPLDWLRKRVEGQVYRACKECYPELEKNSYKKKGGS